MIDIEAIKLLQSIHPEWVLHPLSSPKDGGNSPGKRPFLKGWQTLQKTPDNIPEYVKKGCNIGLVCGKASCVTVIDFAVFANFAVYCASMLAEPLLLRSSSPLTAIMQNGEI